MKNEILSDNGYVLEINVGTVKHPCAVMTINKRDYRKLRTQYKGYIHAERRCQTLYARINIGSTCMLVHRLIHPDWSNIDHRDGNGMNNCRRNLRKATGSQNSSNRTKLHVNNRSGHTGVRPTPGGRWKAVLVAAGRAYALGVYSDKADAVLARLKAEKKHYRSFMPVENRKLLAAVR